MTTHHRPITRDEESMTPRAILAEAVGFCGPLTIEQVGLVCDAGLAGREEFEPIVDSDLGLPYVRSRWLRPGSASWLSPDLDESQPPFSYVGYAPTLRTDPSEAERSPQPPLCDGNLRPGVLLLFPPGV